jgi:hypothetical protein
VLLAVVVTAGCQVRSQVTLKVRDDGSGTVEVKVGLDAEALSQVPDLTGDGVSDTADLTKLVRVDDLKATGWRIAATPAPKDGGTTWLTATKPFGTPAEAGKVLAELTSPRAGLRDLKVDRSSSFAMTRYRFSGTADLSGGLEAFADEGLAKVLDGKPLGQDPAAIEARFGKPVAQMFHLTVRVELPGGKARSWSPQLGGKAVDMSASSTIRDHLVLGLAVLSGSCLVALAIVLLTRRRHTA